MPLKSTHGSANLKLGSPDVMYTEGMQYTGPISYQDWLPFRGCPGFKLADFWLWEFFLVRSALVVLTFEVPTDTTTPPPHTHTLLDHLVFSLTSFISQICLCHLLFVDNLKGYHNESFVKLICVSIVHCGPLYWAQASQWPLCQAD